MYLSSYLLLQNESINIIVWKAIHLRRFALVLVSLRVYNGATGDELDGNQP